MNEAERLIDLVSLEFHANSGDVVDMLKDRFSDDEDGTCRKAIDLVVRRAIEVGYTSGYQFAQENRKLLFDTMIAMMDGRTESLRLFREAVEVMSVRSPEMSDASRTEMFGRLLGFMDLMLSGYDDVSADFKRMSS